jgi:hypothetical protein
MKTGEVYNIIPKTFLGRFSLLIFFLGLIIFMIGVFLGSQDHSLASILAVTGMIIYFLGGLMRAYTN